MRGKSECCSPALSIAALSGFQRSACGHAQAAGNVAPDVTHLRVTSQVILSGVTRLGVNLGEQNFYDSGQMLRNLLARNPDFAPMTYRSIFHCQTGGQARCVDSRPGIQFPADFWNGARYEVLEGAAAGQRGTVRASGRGRGRICSRLSTPPAMRSATETGWRWKKNFRAILRRAGGPRCAAERSSRQNEAICHRGRRSIRRCASRLRVRASPRT